MTTTEQLQELLAQSISAFQAQLAASQAEADRRAAEAATSMEALKHQVRELGKQLGGLGNKFGSFAEGLLIPTVKRIFIEELGLQQAAERVRSTAVINGVQRLMELDVFGSANGEHNVACIAEIKSHLREDGIDQILQQLADFPVFFPEHAHKTLYGMIAAIDAPPDLQHRVWREGLYLVLMHGDIAKLTVPADFTPKNFAQSQPLSRVSPH